MFVALHHQVVPTIYTRLDNSSISTNQYSVTDACVPLATATQVVPTIYTRLDNSTISTNQYSVTEHYQEAAWGPAATASPRSAMHQGMPGVFFYYDLSPIKVSCGRGLLLMQIPQGRVSQARQQRAGCGCTLLLKLDAIEVHLY